MIETYRLRFFFRSLLIKYGLVVGILSTSCQQAHEQVTQIKPIIPFAATRELSSWATGSWSDARILRILLSFTHSPNLLIDSTLWFISLRSKDNPLFLSSSYNRHLCDCVHRTWRNRKEHVHRGTTKRQATRNADRRLFRRGLDESILGL